MGLAEPSPTLNRLRQTLAGVDPSLVPRLPEERCKLALGGPVDATLGGGLAGGELHEFAPAAPMHLAAATGCPTVVLFGPMDPRVWGPWPAGGLKEAWNASGTIQNRGNVWIVQNPLPCLPCTFEGCERHVGSASICLEELSADQVLAAVDQALASTPPRAAVA